MEAGKPSMIHDRWLSFPSAPTADVTRDLKAGLRYFSKRSPGSWICMSLSTNLSPSFMATSVSLLQIHGEFRPANLCHNQIMPWAESKKTRAARCDPEPTRRLHLAWRRKDLWPKRSRLDLPAEPPIPSVLRCRPRHRALGGRSANQPGQASFLSPARCVRRVGLDCGSNARQLLAMSNFCPLRSDQVISSSSSLPSRVEVALFSSHTWDLARAEAFVRFFKDAH